LGRLRRRESLGDIEFKMADNAVNANDFNVNYFDMDEISDVLNEIERPVHEMVRLGKILCTKDDCIAQRAFFLR
jgi:hypothetical protein